MPVTARPAQLALAAVAAAVAAFGITGVAQVIAPGPAAGTVRDHVTLQVPGGQLPQELRSVPIAVRSGKAGAGADIELASGTAKDGRYESPVPLAGTRICVDLPTGWKLHDVAVDGRLGCTDVQPDTTKDVALSLERSG